jgi:citrate synthase
MPDPATLVTGEKNLELPFVQATQGNDGYDIGKLLAATGDTTFDIGFANTAVCKSAITYIDGEAGVLQYRGYPIEQLAEKSTFMETSYLVLYGELPTAEELATFTEKISRHMVIDERLRELFRIFPRRSHPMPVLSAAITALSTFSRDNTGFEPDQIEAATHRLHGEGADAGRLRVQELDRRARSCTRTTRCPTSRTSCGCRSAYPTEPYEWIDEITRAWTCC